MRQRRSAEGSEGGTSWLARIGILLLSVALFFGLLEGLVRSFVQRPAQTHSEFVRGDPELLWRLTPHESGTLATNELGLRDTPFARDADFVILVLGDSVSWGHGVETVESFPYLLEGLLAQRLPGRSFEVVNAGVPGYSTFQQARYLELHGLALQPDAIVLQFTLNDVVERYEALAEWGGANVFLGLDTRQLARGPHGFLLRHSRFYEELTRLLVTLARDRQSYGVRNLSRDTLSPELEAAWQTTLEELEAIRRLARAHGIPLLLAIAPYAYQLEDPAGTGQPQQRLGAIAEGGGVEVVDWLPAFAEAREADLLLDSNHFTPAGHALAARALVEPLARILESR